MLEIVLDTNVLISAIVFGGKPRDILELVIKGKVKLAVSHEILEELELVLKGRKFNYPPRIVNSIVREIESLSELVTPDIVLREIKEDPQDNRILECACQSQSQFIISGDAHLLKLETYTCPPQMNRRESIRIMNPETLLALLYKRK